MLYYVVSFLSCFFLRVSSLHALVKKVFVTCCNDGMLTMLLAYVRGVTCHENG